MNTEITKELVQKISNEVINKNAIRDFQLIKSQGYGYSESGYRIVTSNDPKFKNHIFIISELITFKNGSIEDSRYKFYPFDLDGNPLQYTIKDYPSDFVTKTLTDVVI